MTYPNNPRLVERYLRRVRWHLSDLPAARQEQIIAELEAQLADAAAEQGLDLAAPASQRSLIASMGPSWRLGPALRRAHLVGALSLRERLLFVGGGLGSLLYLALPFLGLFAALLTQTDENAAEGMLIFGVLLAPLLLAPTLVTLYRIYQPHAPRLSRAMLASGGAGLGAGVLVAVLALLAERGSDTIALPPALQLLLQVCLLLNGVWPLLAGAIGVRTKVWPLVPLGVLAIAMGLGWSGFVVGVGAISWLGSAGQVFGPLLWVGLATLLLSQLAWAPWMGVRLMRTRIRPAAS